MDNKNTDYKIKYGTHEWYLYHNRKNEDPIIPLILLSCFLFICKGGIATIILIWAYYFHWAHENNEELNRDPEILLSRKYCKEFKERFKKL